LDTPVFALLSEAEPAFLLAALVAAENAGFELAGLALRSEQALVQLEWKPAELPPAPRENMLSDEPIRQTLRAYLRRRNEPAPYLSLFASSATTFIKDGFLRDEPVPDTPESSQSSQSGLAALHAAIQKIFLDRSFMTRFGGSLQAPERALWWLAEPAQDRLTLSDEIEMEIVRNLQHAPGSTFTDIDIALCHKFPGLLTPSLDLIQVCLESYGQPQPENSAAWFLNLADIPSTRRSDMQTTS